jgi:hypothetical protein
LPISPEGQQTHHPNAEPHHWLHTQRRGDFAPRQTNRETAHPMIA